MTISNGHEDLKNDWNGAWEQMWSLNNVKNELSLVIWSVLFMHKWFLFTNLISIFTNDHIHGVFFSINLFNSLSIKNSRLDLYKFTINKIFHMNIIDYSKENQRKKIPLSIKNHGNHFSQNHKANWSFVEYLNLDSFVMKWCLI